MADIVYNKFLHNLFTKKIDLEGDTLKLMLLEDTYTPDKDHNIYSDVSGYQVLSGSGYTTGGEILTGATVTENDSGNNSSFDGDNITWASLTKSFRYAILYDNTLTDKDLIFCLDCGSQNVEGVDFTMFWDSDGILNAAQL